MTTLEAVRGHATDASRRAAWRRLLGLVLATAVSAASCGNTRHDADKPPTAGGEAVAAGADSGGSLGDGAGRSPANDQGGGVASAGTVHTAGSGGLPVASGGAPPAHPLIMGDAGCPPAAPGTSSCTQSAISCVYRGIAAGLSEANEPFHCLCEAGAWTCVQSAENGDATCPFVAGLPDEKEACPAPGASCRYALLAQSALAVCYCNESEAAGGAAAAPIHHWFCGL
jgi:hypothetical protein